MTSYLIDNSALARYGQPTVSAALTPLIARGLVGVSIVTELEFGYSSRSPHDYERGRELLAELLPVGLSPRAEQTARTLQERLVRTGTHRAVALADILIAASALEEGVTILHYDADFDLIAEVTGQATEWVVPRGSI